MLKEKKNCLFCEKEFFYYPNSRNEGKYCSLSCKYSDKKRLFKSNCLMCGKEMQYYLRKGRKTKHKKYCSKSCYGKSKIGIPSAMKDKKQSKNARKKMSKSKKGRIFSEETIKKMGNTRKKMLSDKTQRNAFLNRMSRGLKKFPNKPEKILIKIISKNNIPLKYVGDGKIWISDKNGNNFNPDFINIKRKVIIELFGEYWHNRKDIIKRDLLRIHAYKRCGYEPLIVWDYELSNKGEVLNKINSLLHNKKEVLI